MRVIIAFFRAVVNGTSMAYTQLMKTFFVTLVMTLFVTVFMWLMNIAGFKEINYFFFFIGGIMIFFIGLNPIAVIASVLYGGVSGGIRKEGVMKGALDGPGRLIHLIVGLMYTYFCIAGVLATTSFKESPSSFFAILAMVTLFCAMSVFFSRGFGRLARFLTYTYAFYVCTCALWAIVPVDAKINMGMKGKVIQRIDNVIGSGKESVKNQIDVIVQKENVAESNAIRKKNLKEKALSDSLRIARSESDAKRKRIEEKYDAEQKNAQQKKEIEDKLNSLIK